MSQSPTYTAAQREDGSWGLKCPDGRIIGTARTEDAAQFGVDVAIWKQENVVAELLEALKSALQALELERVCDPECISCTKARALIAKAEAAV